MIPVHIWEGKCKQSKLVKTFYLPIQNSNLLTHPLVQGSRFVNVFSSTTLFFVPSRALAMQHFLECSPIVSQCFLLSYCYLFCKFRWWCFLNLTRKYQWKIFQAISRTLFSPSKWFLNRFETETSRGVVVLSDTSSNKQIACAPAMTMIFTSLLLPSNKL